MQTFGDDAAPIAALTSEQSHSALNRRDSTFARCFTQFRRSEGVVIAFFVYTAIYCLLHDDSFRHRLIAVIVPVLLFGLVCAANLWGNRKINVARDWMLQGAVLAGYWQMGWFVRGHDLRFEQSWHELDREILNRWGLRQLIEDSGRILPGLLELCYLLLYAIPPACLAVLYWQRAPRIHIDRFLLTFTLGTLIAYALLPAIAVASPRIAFAGQALPGAVTLWRTVNVWILDHMDIATSVFPSGHVAVAFSSALGIRRALPDKRGVFTGFLVIACIVFVATVYGRYHYAADGAASIAISLATWLVCETLDRNG